MLEAQEQSVDEQDLAGELAGEDGASRIGRRKGSLPFVRPEPITTTKLGSLGSQARVTTRTKAGSNLEIAQIQAPSTIADFYDFGGILGQGGFGTVSEIHHAKTFEPFAGKVVRKESFRDVLGSEDVFRKVMETLLNYEHPHVVRLLHVFEDGCHYYVVMDLCPGGTLRRLVRDTPGALPQRLVEEILGQTAAAVGFLHALQILHRDVKPPNVMLLTDAGEAAVEAAAAGRRVGVSLVDFDMCSFVDERGEVCSTHLDGTPGYLAPEVLRDFRYTVASDLFAYGCLVYFVLKREDPCPGVSATHLSTRDLEAALQSWLVDTLALCEEAVRTTGAASVPCAPASAQLSAFSPTSGDATPNGVPHQLLKAHVASPASSASGACRVSLLDPTYQDVPVRLWQLVAWCLARDPAFRPPSVAAILESSFLRADVGSPHGRSPVTANTMTSGRTPGTSKKDRSSRKAGRTSIDDILRLSAPQG